jgi:hypothetical protein
MPVLADVIPSYIECVTVLTDDDADGCRFAGELADRIRARRIQVRRVVANRWRPAA